MIKIRRGIFETNSSSVHAIAVSTGTNLKDLDMTSYNKNNLDHKILEIKGTNFGWAFCEYTNPNELISYLYTACSKLNRLQEFKEKVLGWLDEENIAYRVIEDDDYHYIDHVEETKEFVDYVLKNKKHLLNFLFGNSFIETGNDNDSMYEPYVTKDDIDKYKLKVFYKY